MAARLRVHLVLFGIVLAATTVAQGPGVDLSALVLRPLGPAAMSGRVSSLAVREDKPSTFYVATASGGLFKTVNNGTTFVPLFQHEKAVSIGAIALAPSDSTQLWVGTGEANNRNSTSWGNGVYFSKDAGKTFTYKGLPMSQHIGCIAVHPKDPSFVFVAAVGGLWGPNPERGLYRTKDAGETWDLVLKVDALTGATDVCIDPVHPELVYCAMYERQRDGFDGNHPAKRWGPGSGIYKSSDGGTTWRKLTAGLPTVAMGRIALEIYRKDPSHVYALIETEQTGQRPEGAPPPPRAEPGTAQMGVGQTGEDAHAGAKVTDVTQGGPAAAAGLQNGDIVLAVDGVPTTGYAELLEVVGEQRADENAELVVLRGDKIEKLEITWGNRGARFGGSRNRASFEGELAGQRENVMKQQGPNGFQTGGLFLSKDHGETWERINSLNPRPYYFSVLRVDPSDERYVYVPGIAFYMSTDGGSTFQRKNLPNVHVDHHALWINPQDGRHLLLGCDGGVNATWDRGTSWEAFENMDAGQAYHAVADSRRPYWVYAGYQDNGSWGSPSETPHSEGILNTHVFKIGGGDGFVVRVDPEDPDVVYYESQGGAMGWLNVMTGARGRISRGGNPIAQMQGGRSQARESFNWNAPLVISHYNPRTIYFAGEHVYRSIDRGRVSEQISPRLTNPVQGEPSARPSVYTLSESPRQRGVLWAGTDDGNLWVTQDDGKTWNDRSKVVHELLPNGQPLWISYVFASNHKGARAYLAIDGHRSNDRRPYVFATEDFGGKWTRLATELPEDAGSVHAIVEDDANEDLLYLGSEMGMWISLDRGKSWQRLGKPFPTVACRDFDIQTREQHLIIATHGRSVWMLDVRPLRALTAANRKKDVFLVAPNDVLRLARRSLGKSGHRHFAIPNPPQRAELYYWLGKDTNEAVDIVVRDVLGKEVWRQEGKKTAGLHRIDWNLQPARPPGGRGGGGPRQGAGVRGPVPAGTYSVTLSVGGAKLIETFAIDDSTAPLDVSWPRPPAVGEGNLAGEGDESEREDAADEGRDR